jgi:hypothetical protein
MSRATHVLQWDGTTGRLAAMFGKSLKPSLSSDRSLQLDFVKSESLVNADQHAALNTFPGLVHTARHTTEMDHAQSRCPNPSGKEPPKAGFVTGVKS